MPQQMTIQQAVDLARSAHSAGRLLEAESIYRQVLAAQPDPHVYAELGSVLADEKKFEQAIAVYRQALALQPDLAYLHHNLATALESIGKPDEAIAAYRSALALDATIAQTHYNLGKLLQDQEQFEPAIKEYGRALQLKPDYFEAHSNIGAAWLALKKIDDAIRAFELARQLRPDHPDASRNLAGALLLSGDLPRGFDAYARWKSLEPVSSVYQRAPQPQWDGSDLNGRRILLWEEQGFGDMIQFVRYAPLVQSRGGRVLLACSRQLHRLLRSATGIDELVTDGDPWPAFDVRCSLLDLPRIFGTTLQTIPASPAYLHADAELVEQWRQRLPRGDKTRIGVCWAGRPNHPDDQKRSMPLSALAPLLELPEIQLFSLQVGSAAEQVAALGNWNIIDWTKELANFADTAALIHNLDLVITVDTAVAHLAGAMGKPVWVMLPFIPEWRWLLDRDDCPWYPSMRLFRQPHPGDWTSVIADVARGIG